MRGRPIRALFWSWSSRLVPRLSTPSATSRAAQLDPVFAPTDLGTSTLSSSHHRFCAASAATLIKKLIFIPATMLIYQDIISGQSTKPPLWTILYAYLTLELLFINSIPHIHLNTYWCELMMPFRFLLAWTSIDIPTSRTFYRDTSRETDR